MCPSAPNDNSTTLNTTPDSPTIVNSPTPPTDNRPMPGEHSFRIPTEPPDESDLERNYKQETLEFINNLSRREQERAIERYGGLRPFSMLSRALKSLKLESASKSVDKAGSSIGKAIGKARAWFDRVGERSTSENEELTIDENLQRAGIYSKNPWWKQAAKIGAKVIGGFGVAGAMVMTGGAGALTGLLWAGGLKEGYDGILQTAEHVGWGRRRTATELERQAFVSEKIDHLKSRVLDESNPITEAEYQQLITDIIQTENDLIAQQEKNALGEQKGRKIRSITTSALTIGTGLFAGVPLGSANLDQDNTNLATAARDVFNRPTLPVMDDSHRLFWSALNGEQFAYGHSNLLEAIRDTLNGSTPLSEEHSYLKDLISATNDHALGPFKLTELNAYGQTTHELGRALPLPAWLNMGAAGAYALLEPIRHFFRNPDFKNPADTPQDKEPKPRQIQNLPDAPSPEPAGKVEKTETKTPITDPEKEREAITAYLTKEPKEYRQEIADAALSFGAMPAECRVGILIPVSLNEKGHIYQTLEQYAKQKDIDGKPINSKLYEICLDLRAEPGKDNELQTVVQEIDRFKRDHPDVLVNYISQALRSTGSIRKKLADVLVARSIARPTQDKPFYLVSNDTDTTELSEKYLTTIIDHFDSHPEVQVATGRNEFGNQNIPYLFAARRLWQIAERLQTSPRYYDRPIEGIDDTPTDLDNTDLVRFTFGNNQFIRSSAYAIAGGYSENRQATEDLYLSEGIAHHFGRDAIGYIPRNAAVVTDTSHDLDLANKGLPLTRAFGSLVQTGAYTPDNSVSRNVENLDIDNPDFLQQLSFDASAVFATIQHRFFFRELFNLPEYNKLINEEKTAATKQRLSEIINSEWTNKQGIGELARRRTEKLFEKAMLFWGAYSKPKDAATGEEKFERGYKVTYDNDFNPTVEITNADKLKEGLKKYKYDQTFRQNMRKALGL